MSETGSGMSTLAVTLVALAALVVLVLVLSLFSGGGAGSLTRLFTGGGVIAPLYAVVAAL